MTIKCDEYEHVGVIAVQGDFAGEQVDAVRQAVDGWLDRADGCRMVFDLEKTDFIDSRGLEAITWAIGRCGSGGRLAVAAPGETCRKIFEITRLDRRIELCSDLPAALKAVDAA